jgi:hypothetical protein
MKKVKNHHDLTNLALCLLRKACGTWADVTNVAEIR